MKYTLGLFIFFTFSASALETDNYLVWDRDLRDSGQVINRYFNNEIKRVLKDPKSSSLSCEEITQRIGDVFESHLVHDNPVENHLIELLGPDEIYPHTLFYVPESIYRDPFRIYIPYFGLAPNIQVKGFYFGTDKLSHFASTGRIYYNVFKRTSKLEEAISWGIRDEKTLHGFWPSGVFSYADLEANYQGFLFYYGLCHGKKPYLEFEDSQWTLRREFRIEHYVSGLWDESYLESYRLPKNWEKVKIVLADKYCVQRNSELVRSRFHYYDTHLPVRSSMRYLKSPRLPKAQSFQALCSFPSTKSL